MPRQSFIFRLQPCSSNGLYKKGGWRRVSCILVSRPRELAYTLGPMLRTPLRMTPRYRSGRFRLSFRHERSYRSIRLQGGHVRSSEFVSLRHDHLPADHPDDFQAVGYAILGGIALAFIRPRIPIASVSSQDERSTRREKPVSRLLARWKQTLSGRGSIDLQFLRRTTFYAFAGNILLSSLSNFLPAVYIPSMSDPSALL